MSNDALPKNLKHLRACMVCSLVKTLDQFEKDGCDNCEAVLHFRSNRENVYDCTSTNFDGLVASCIPRDSWVCKWQRITKFTTGLYAISVHGRLPSSIVSLLRKAGYAYKRRDTSKV